MASQLSRQVQKDVQPRQRSVCPQKSTTRRHKNVILIVEDNSSTRFTKCRSLCARTLKTFTAISGFLRQVCRKLSADSRNRVVELVASALAGYRPPSKTATSASKLPLRSMPRSCCQCRLNYLYCPLFDDQKLAPHVALS